MSCIISYTFMANLITIVRVILLFVGIGFIYSHNIYGEILAFAIVIIVIIMDWIDGYVARRRGNTTPFGAVLDIMGDRIVESSLWIVFAH
ncbi:MAG: CDP-alcohol phosphatidyltransferase family protein, partial [Nitrospirota bacterium]